MKASSIIMMEDDRLRVEAIGIDTSTGQITTVGTPAEVQAGALGFAVTDLGTSVLMPGFIDPRNHFALSGVVTQEPAHSITPHVGYPTHADVQALWKELDASTPAGEALVFSGLDRLLQGAPELSADPYEVDVETLTDQARVEATWVNGRKIDTDAFITQIEAMDPSEHHALPHAVMAHKC